MIIEKAQACLGFFMLKAYPIQRLASDAIVLITQIKPLFSKRVLLKTLNS